VSFKRASLLDRRKVIPILDAMRDDWDRRARANARHYVATGKTDWTAQEFFAAGEESVRLLILTDMHNICQGKYPKSLRVLEIGCGAARVTKALARLFGEVHAVDVSGEMVRIARQELADCPNAHVYQNNGMDLSVVPDLLFDFAFSTIVFQHIPSRAIIENYIRETGRLLRPGALFKFEVQGRVAPSLQHPIRRQLRKWLRLLHSNRGGSQGEDRTWFGVPVSPDEAQQMAASTGFELRYEAGRGEPRYWLWFFKRDPSTP